MPNLSLKEVFGTARPIIAMVHLAPLPGSPGFDAKGGMDAVIAAAAADLKRLRAGGVDAVMFGNEGDRPYLLKATPQSLAAMAAAIGVIKRDIGCPFGVDYLWDPVATVALGAATGAAFAREIFTGVYASDMGLWRPDGAQALRLRRELGRGDMKLLFNINAEFASPLDSRPIEKRAASAVFSSMADILCVSGPMTGQPVDGADLKRVKDAVKDVPVFANTGVNIDNVRDILRVADGCVIGTHFKVDGNTWNPVDGGRVRRFMDVVRKLR
ncbi:MAG: BtpA/SgcQ family protein [Dongiaceae bacterium]